MPVFEGENLRISKPVLIKKWQVTYYLISTKQLSQSKPAPLLIWRASVGNRNSTGSQLYESFCDSKVVAVALRDLYQSSLMVRMKSCEGNVTGLIPTTVEGAVKIKVISHLEPNWKRVTEVMKVNLILCPLICE